MIKKTLVLFAFILFFFGASATTVQPNDSIENLSLIQKVEKWYDANMDYTSITILMTIESSFIPFPSEVVIPPAAYIASKENSHLNIYLVILFGTLGAIIGAFINYFLALWLGRPLIYKFADSKLGHALLLSSEKIQKAEDYFVKHGKISTFIGRLIPGIRQLISIPAGLAKMNIASFVLYTFLGALIWNSILALVGYLAQGKADLINEYSHELSMIIMGIFVVAVVYFIVKYFRTKKK